MIKDVFVFPDGTVAVCDEAGQQMPELQRGKFEENRLAIIEQSSAETRFMHWKFKHEILTLEFFRAFTAFEFEIENRWAMRRGSRTLAVVALVEVL